MAHTWNIARRIADRVAADPTRPALTVDGRTLSYGELWGRAGALATRLPAPAEGETAPVTALMAHRQLSSYVAILACLIRGNTYVPVNVAHPPERNLRVLRKSGARRLVCGEELVDSLQQVLAGATALDLELVVLADAADASAGGPLPTPDVPASRRAYILFTSGSTGDPKGVPITHRALTGYLEAASGLMPTGPDDRYSQTFELTFDLSIHDLLMCWTSGAHLVVPTAAEFARPAAYIRAHAITRWFSVPSLAYQMRLQGDLTPGAFPSLRTSLFCGEALPSRLAEDWARAAPNGTVENWYGPTEATIACARHVIPRDARSAAEHDLVPIGEAFPGMTLSIHAEDLSPAPDGTPGELLLGGRQLSEGYLEEPERNARAFITLPGRDGTYYRTGDRVVRDPGGPVRFLGRVDNQVKVRGFRIELGEIEAALRSAAGGVNAVALSWPPGEPSGRFVVAALETDRVDVPAVLTAAARSLPDYMVPANLVCLPKFPVNASGKTDRAAIARQVDGLISETARDTDLSDLPAPARRLMEAVLAVSPALSRQGVLEARTLMAAGMDSLSFISLTAEIERLYSRTLELEEVVHLSLLSFDDMVDHLERGTRKRGPASWIARWLGRQRGKERPGRRTNRAAQFVARFPVALAGSLDPVVLAIGSSCTFRAVAPEDFEHEALRCGRRVTCFNVGMAAIDVTGLSRLAAWTARQCLGRGVRPVVALYELDPVQVSVLPSPRETPLPEAFFAGTSAPKPDGRYAQEFEWSAADRGAWIGEAGAHAAKRRANWEKERDTEIARIYAGDVRFVPEAIDAWSRGLRALQSVADRTVVFVHPVNSTMMRELPDRLRGDRFEALMRQVSGMDGIELIPPDTFDLEDADFLDINHVNAATGRPRTSRQLARWLFGQDR